MNIVVDGTDKLPTRYLTNDACVLLKKPNVYGSIFRFEGQASVFAPHLNGPCYRCLYPEPPPPGMVPSCAEGGVLGRFARHHRRIQATEILKLALGKGSSLIGRLLLFNALEMKFRELRLRRDPLCPFVWREPDHHQADRLPAILRYRPQPATAMSNPDESDRAGNEARAGRPKTRHQSDRCARTGRISDSTSMGFPLFPLSVLPQRFTELGPNQQVYIHCKSGVRSIEGAALFCASRASNYLKKRQRRHQRLSDEIDHNVPKY